MEQLSTFGSRLSLEQQRNGMRAVFTNKERMLYNKFEGLNTTLSLIDTRNNNISVNKHWKLVLIFSVQRLFGLYQCNYPLN